MKPINNIVKNHLKDLCSKSIERAENDFTVNIENKIKSLNHFAQLKIVVEESDRLEKITEESEYPFYIHNHSSDNWLLDQFASRTFILNNDESEQVSEAVYIGHYDQLVNKRKYDLRDQIPPYTYSDFIAGKIDPYFANFDTNYNIPRGDYYKIRRWQTERLVKIVSFESLKLIKKIQNHCKSLSEPLEFIKTEREKIDSEINSCKPIAKDIKAALSGMFMLQDQSFQNFNDEILIDCFKFFLEEKITWKYMFPVYLNPLVDAVNKKSKHLVCNESTIFFIISKVAYWFDAVIDGQSIQQPVVETDWDKLYAKLKTEAAEKVEVLKKKINNYVEKPNLSKQNIKTYLHEQFEIYRKMFNAFESKDIFISIRIGEESKDNDTILKEIFVTESFFGNRIEAEAALIKDAIVIHELLWEVVQIYACVFDTHKMDFPDSNGEYLDIMHLTNQMVLDKELHSKVRQSMDDFMHHFHAYSLPIEVHFQNSKEMLADVFDKSLHRLEELLNDSESTNKILYLQSRLKELRHREVRIKELVKTKDFRLRDFKFDKLFKEFLEIEADFIRETGQINYRPALPTGIKTAALTESKPSFDTLLSEKNKVFMLNMLEGLSFTVNGKPVMSDRKKSGLRGIVEASIEKNILPNQTIHSLCVIIADKIGLPLKAKLADTFTCKEMKKRASLYITSNYPK